MELLGELEGAGPHCCCACEYNPRLLPPVVKRVPLLGEPPDHLEEVLLLQHGLEVGVGGRVDVEDDEAVPVVIVVVVGLVRANREKDKKREKRETRERERERVRSVLNASLPVLEVFKYLGPLLKELKGVGEGGSWLWRSFWLCLIPLAPLCR